MPRAKPVSPRTELTSEERRERRKLRREKQREDNVKRAAKMHAARLKSEANGAKLTPQHNQSIFVGCSGWRYWKWRDSFYDGVPQNDWFGHYLKTLTPSKSTLRSTLGRPLPAFRPGAVSRERKRSSIRSRSASSSPTSRSSRAQRRS